MMCNSKVLTKVEGRPFKIMVGSAMLYGMETVAVTRNQKRKINMAEMSLRFSLGKERSENVRNIIRIGLPGKKLQEIRFRWKRGLAWRDEECESEGQENGVGPAEEEGEGTKKKKRSQYLCLFAGIGSG